MSKEDKPEGVTILDNHRPSNKWADTTDAEPLTDIKKFQKEWD